MAHESWENAHLIHKVKTKRAVFDAISTLTTLKSPTFVWRGQVSSAWTLFPSAYRRRQDPNQDEVRDDQCGLIESARIRRHDHFDGWAMPDLALLALLQHNGAATILVDVTTDPFVALYFACEESSAHDKEHGLLLAIDVSAKGKDPRTIRYDLGHEAALKDVLKELGDRLGLYTPPDVSPRIMAQRSRFVFGQYHDHPYSTLPVERKDWTEEKLGKVFSNDRSVGQPPKPAIVGIEIHPDLKPALREVLEQSFGMTGVTLFPDLHGFAAAYGIK